MERRDFIVDTLVKTGFRTSLKGFDQFCMCVELCSDDSSLTIDSIYIRVAVVFGCSKSAVEKNLRRLFDSSDACSAVGKLFGIEPIDAGTKEIVTMFVKYVSLNRDSYELGVK